MVKNTRRVILNLTHIELAQIIQALQCYEDELEQYGMAFEHIDDLKIKLAEIYAETFII